MTADSKLWIRGGRVVDPSQRLDEVVDLLVVDGKIERLETTLSAAAQSGARVVEAQGLVVAPGFIDLHVHLREPGQEYKETVRTGTMAAAAGGFTAVACMANTSPVNDNRSVTEHVLTEARRHGFAPQPQRIRRHQLAQGPPGQWPRRHHADRATRRDPIDRIGAAGAERRDGGEPDVGHVHGAVHHA